MDPVTTTELLKALREPGNERVWAEFDGRFRPILLGMGRRMGLSESDAADVAQETLLEFFRDVPRSYERQRGRLRSWLFGIARHRVRDGLERAARHAPAGGDSYLALLPDDAELERHWEAEISAALTQRALEALRRIKDVDATSVAVFVEYALQGRDPAAVAAEFGLSASAVYSIKARCLKRLHELRKQIAADLFDD